MFSGYLVDLFGSMCCCVSLFVYNCFDCVLSLWFVGLLDLVAVVCVRDWLVTLGLVCGRALVYLTCLAFDFYLGGLLGLSVLVACCVWFLVRFLGLFTWDCSF